MASKHSEYDIFLSYNWDHKAHVQKLYEKLVHMNLKVWVDFKELDNTPLTDQLADGITNSRVFMCCVTKKYSQSDNCKLEFHYAKTNKKLMIILMFEHYNNIEKGIQIIINPQTRYNIELTSLSQVHKYLKV